MIECMQDSYEPHKVRVGLRGMEVWLTLVEATQLHDQLGYILANPITPITKPIKLFQLYEKKGTQK